MIHKLEIKTHQRNELIDITDRVQEIINKTDCQNGFVICFVPHTTAALTINENADPDVKRDILYKLENLFPQRDGYHHAEGNSDSHIKASLFGFSEHILIELGRLLLGTWQGIYFCEFDGPRSRKLIIKVVSSD